MPSRTLPSRPNLAQLKLQASELLHFHREGKPAAAARIAAHLPRMRGHPQQPVLDRPLALADAQRVLAREYGFDNWARLKHHVETVDRVAKFKPHSRFDDAVAAIDAGDLERLRSLIASDPALIHARTNLEPPYGYFTGATLLHHVAGNPDRGRLTGEPGPLPKNIVAIARRLLDSGADVDAMTLGPNGGTTMSLIITTKQASDAGVSGPLMDLLLERGAVLDLHDNWCHFFLAASRLCVKFSFCVNPALYARPCGPESLDQVLRPWRVIGRGRRYRLRPIPGAGT